MALRLRPIEKDLENASTDLTTLRGDFERRLTAMHDDSKTERENMERRLSGVERSYASREELAAAINAIGGRFDRGVDRMENSIKSLGDKVDGLNVRLGQVEISRHDV